MIPYAPAGCNTCHTSGGGSPRNPFGLAVEARVTPGGSQEFWGPELAALDSDGDGFTNGRELQDPNGAWRPGQAAPATALLVSKPGDASSFPQENGAQVPASIGAIDVLQTVPVDEGATVVVSNGYLRVLDPDTPTNQLAFTVNSGPSHGRLNRSAFTQADIDNSLVSYVHDGSETQRDSLSFSVVDGSGLEFARTWLRFAVRALNDGPIIPSIENQHIKEGEFLVLDVAATDPEGDAIQMTVTALPPGAALEGTMLKWFPFYDQAGIYPLAVTYEDGQGGTSRLRLDIQVAEAPLPVLMTEPSLLEFGDVPAGETVDRSFALTNDHPVTMELVPFSSTSPHLNVHSPVLPMILQSGEKIDIVARFSATDDIADVQTAQLTSATKLGTVQVAAVGRSVWRRLVAESDNISFFPAVIGDTLWRTLVLTNPGNLPLEIDAELPVESPFGVEPTSLNFSGGEQHTVRLFFVPVTTDPVEVVLTLAHEEGQSTILLRCQGREPEEGLVAIDFNLDLGNQQQRLLGGAVPGSIHMLQLHAKGAPEVVGWNVRIDFNPDELSYVEGSFVPGRFLDRLNPTEQVSSNSVEIGGTILAEEIPASGNGILGTLSFQVLDGFSGQTELAVSRVIWHRDDEVGLDRSVVFAPANITAANVELVKAGDFNADGSIDMNDFLLFADQFNRRVPPAEPRFDLDDDGHIHHVDFFLFADLAGQER